jgi:sugar/nucleoside kinase (ribokinase family)
LGSKVEVKNLIFSTGGGATNTAVTFSRQGLKTAALFKIGKDRAGEEIFDELKRENVSIMAVIDWKGSTAYSTILISPNGERTILVYRGTSDELTHEEIPFNRLKTRWAYISPGGIDFWLVNDLVNHFYKNGVAIAINPSKKLIEKKLTGLSNILSKAKVVILNREEAAYLTGINYQREKSIFKELDRAVPGIAVMTDGERGVLASDGHKIYHTGVFKEKKVVDRTGAGDAFGSGFVAGLIHRKEGCEKGLCRPDNIKYAIRLGSANATSVIEHISAKTGILTKIEFEKNERWKNLHIETVKL